MRILFIITRSDAVGGAQVYLKDLSKAFIKDGHDVLVVAGTSVIGEDNFFVRNQIPFYACPHLCRSIQPIQDFQSIRFINNIVKTFRPDVISAHSSKAGLIGRISARVNHIPCIFTVHGWAFTEGVSQPKRSLYKIIEKLISPLSGKIICVSDYDARIGSEAGIKSSLMTRIYNGIIDIPTVLRAYPRNNLNPSVSIVMIARFDEPKDHRTLLHAFRSVHGAKLSLVGDGSNLSSIMALAEDLGLSDKVKFMGFREDIPEILSQAHIFTLISRWEALPLTIIEAMRAGLPVVISDVGGAAETIVEGVSGFAVPRSNVDVLRDRLNQLVADAQLRERMGKAARQRYEQLFTFERMYSETRQAYEAVLSQYKNSR
ncbi:MAG: hypothetical protein RLZZ597_2439 [Cyanobacteriota bacterium]|jgi:glycosyltransferase involved in cell wall biosynthesis